MGKISFYVHRIQRIRSWNERNRATEKDFIIII